MIIRLPGRIRIDVYRGPKIEPGPYVAPSPPKPYVMPPIGTEAAAVIVATNSRNGLAMVKLDGLGSHTIFVGEQRDD